MYGMRFSHFLANYLLVPLIVAAAPAGAVADTAHSAKGSLTVTSSAFKANEAIPSEYTCDGAEKSPPLSWSNVPTGAKSIAILVDDPDAPKGTFTHWIVTNIPPSETSLSAAGSLPQGATAAKNDKGATGYAGPCPPSGKHHYHFKVYALDTTIAKPTSRGAFLKAIDGHVLADGELVATYERQGAPRGDTRTP
jgi:Raf kinase inhibitor-like YbhB/YbcL family protein